jgi:hypothetical protein
MSWLPKALGSLATLGCLTLLAPARPPDLPKADKKMVTKPAAAPPAAGKFVRLRLDAHKQPVALETAVVSYVPASGKGNLVVDLVSVVHIADRPYYEQLNARLGKYDVVLYELVAPKGTRILRGGKRDSNNPIALLQKLIKTVLRLDLQTEQIDYTRKNFVHADLSPDEMAEAMRKRGETGLTLVLGIAADILRQQNLQQMKKGDPGVAEDLDPLSLLLDPQAAVKLKRLMARQLAGMDTEDGGLGHTLNNLLIVDRNKAALRALQKELVNGHKRIAIFYGAGHMPDMQRRLLADFGLRRQGEQWLRAWDLEARNTGLGDLLKLLEP